PTAVATLKHGRRPGRHVYISACGYHGAGRGAPERPGGGVAASANAPTTWAPAPTNALREAWSVAPVVTTSSTISTGTPAGRALTTRTAPCLRVRAAAPSRWVLPPLRRSTSAAHTRAPVPRDRPRASATARSAATRRRLTRRRQPEGAGTTSRSAGASPESATGASGRASSAPRSRPARVATVARTGPRSGREPLFQASTACRAAPA